MVDCWVPRVLWNPPSGVILTNLLVYDNVHHKVYDIVASSRTINILEVYLSNYDDMVVALQHSSTVIETFPPGLVPIMAEYADKDGTHNMSRVEEKDLEVVCGACVCPRTGDIVLMDNYWRIWRIHPSNWRVTKVMQPFMSSVIGYDQRIPMTHDEDGNLFFTSSDRLSIYKTDYKRVQVLHPSKELGRFSWSFNTRSPISLEWTLPISSLAVTRTEIHLRMTSLVEKGSTKTGPCIISLRGEAESKLDNMHVSNFYQHPSGHDFEVATCSGSSRPFVFVTDHTITGVDPIRATVVVNRGKTFLVYKQEPCAPCLGQLYRVPIVDWKDSMYRSSQ